MALLSIFMSHLDHVLEGRNARLIEIARTIEAAGADQAVFSEHVALAKVIAGEGEAAIFPFPSDENYPEPMVSLAAIAGATTRLRLATGILIAPLRPAILLAKQAATLDNISDGRLDLGIGAGWHVPELSAVGIDPDKKLAVMEEILLACRQLWTGEPASFHGAHVNFDHLMCVPTPLSGAALPVWLAGPPTAKSADRIARMGNGWLPFGNVGPDDLKRGGDHLREAERRHGLPTGSLGIRAELPTHDGATLAARLDSAFAVVPSILDAGVTHLQLPIWRYVKRLDDIGPLVETVRQRLDAL